MKISILERWQRYGREYINIHSRCEDGNRSPLTCFSTARMKEESRTRFRFPGDEFVSCGRFGRAWRLWSLEGFVGAAASCPLQLLKPPSPSRLAFAGVALIERITMSLVSRGDCFEILYSMINVTLPQNPQEIIPDPISHV